MANVSQFDEELKRRAEQAEAKAEQHEEMRIRAEAEAAALKSAYQELLRRAKQQQEAANARENAKKH